MALSDALTAIAGTDAVVPDAFFSIVAVSPNGRTFVSWDFLVTRGPDRIVVLE